MRHGKNKRFSVNVNTPYTTQYDYHTVNLTPYRTASSFSPQRYTDQIDRTYYGGRVGADFCAFN